MCVKFVCVCVFVCDCVWCARKGLLAACGFRPRGPPKRNSLSTGLSGEHVLADPHRTPSFSGYSGFSFTKSGWSTPRPPPLHPYAFTLSPALSPGRLMHVSLIGVSEAPPVRQGLCEEVSWKASSSLPGPMLGLQKRKQGLALTSAVTEP